MPNLVGLGFDFIDAPSNVLERLLPRLHGKISHLSVMAIRSEADALMLKSLADGLPIIHHLSNIAPANPRGPNLLLLEEQDKYSKIMEAVWCNEDVGVWDLGPYFLPSFSPPLFENDVGELVADRINQVSRKSSVPFLPEVPACSFAVGRISLCDFFSKLALLTEVPFLIDLSHVYSYALATNKDPVQVLENLPYERTWQVHVAGGYTSISSPTYYCDSHDRETPAPVLELLEIALDLCGNLRAVTFEAIPTTMSIDAIVTEVDRLNNVVNRSQRALNFYLQHA